MACAHTSWIPPELSIATTVRGSTSEVDLGGELDIVGRPVVRQAIDDVFALEPRRVVLNLSQLTFMDSTGVHLVSETRDRAAATDTELVLIPGPPAIQRVFAIAEAANHRLVFSWAATATCDATSAAVRSQAFIGSRLRDGCQR